MGNPTLFFSESGIDSDRNTTEPLSSVFGIFTIPDKNWDAIHSDFLALTQDSDN